MVQVRSVLADKAELICKAFAANGWIQPSSSSQYGMAYTVALNVLKTGGDFKLIENGNVISVKTQIRGPDGQVIEERG